MPIPTPADRGHHSRVDALFARQAALTPHAVALVDGDRVLDYEQVAERGRWIARLLADAGVRPGDLVGIHLDRTAELPIALLGVLAAGGGYVPLDRSHPDERLADTVAAAGLRVMLSDAAERPAWTPPDTRVLTLSPEPPAADDPRWPAPEGDAEAIAYVLFTSGSTGRPKGVAMPHRGLANLLAGQGPAGLGGPARTLQFAPCAFDVASQEIFTTWLAGGTLVMMPDAVRHSPFALVDHLARHRVERVYLPVVALDVLCRALVSRGTSLPHLRDVVTAGEQLRITPTVRSAFDGPLAARLHNHYGPTETHVVTAHTLAGDPADWPALPPIGRAVPGATTLVVGPDGAPAPPGGTGELLIGGAQVALGYLGRPDLTAERFVDRPDHGRLYRSGDLVRLGEDGVLTFLSRLDDQVKIRGHRVELGEIETTAAEIPGVARAVAVAHADASGHTSLALYVTGDFPDGTAAASRVRSGLATSLPPAMLPSRVHLVSELPVNANGKVDRRKLADTAVGSPR
ncbi:amino acid adenylation domain-containing protein [Streptomyces triticirhizae]|uniref:Amino acid adenylation domain-containing protein n=1 Tax=Streptomyces triticirhizae TaxID=2483353 RepID=A0A3M2KYM1_9ACTN|nr:amino acid adenylation domain-containing protein [Streptomyces triticirhizae]RMI28645.1 amino acid adenylation domain-containing protein [Streptomyces triticirhizae]